MTDKEILDMKIGEQTVREMTSITLLHFVAKKLNGLKTYSAATQELVMAVSTPPLGAMPELEKVRLIRKLIVAGATL